MRAAYLTETGPAARVVVGDLPDPVVAGRGVLVRVHAAAINPIDVYLRLGLVSMPTPFPFVTGSDFAGVVEAVGPGVTRFKVGDRAWGSNQGLLGRPGTLAELVAPDEDYCYPLPEGVSFESAAASALTGITAHLGLFHRTNLVPGETVFVNGGAGGVGSMVVQMAKATGVRVIATAGNAGSAATAERLGADAVIDYKSEDVTARVLGLTGGKGVDVYYETQPPGDWQAVIDRCAFEARIVVMAGRNAAPPLPNGAFYVKGLQMIGFAMFNAPPLRQRVAAEGVATWLAAGAVTPVIGRRFALEQAALAHDLQEENTLKKQGTLQGKVVVVVNG